MPPILRRKKGAKESILLSAKVQVSQRRKPTAGVNRSLGKKKVPIWPWPCVWGAVGICCWSSGWRGRKKKLVWGEENLCFYPVEEPCSVLSNRRVLHRSCKIWGWGQIFWRFVFEENHLFWTIDALMQVWTKKLISLKIFVVRKLFAGTLRGVKMR